jgi:hypothetical protein
MHTAGGSRINRTLIAMLALFALEASAALQRWGPTWSEVTGNLYSRTQMNRTAATIKQIDRKHETARIVKVEPGSHAVVVASPMRKGFAGSDVTLQMHLEPCKRYYLNSQFKSGMGTDWEPAVAMVESIAGCKVPAK